MTDSPKIHANLKDLEESTKIGPFVQALKDNKRITFPDPGEMEWTDAIELMEDLTTDTRLAIKKWLSAEDYQKLMDAKLNLYQFNALGQRVNKHYAAILGEPGN